MKTRHLNGVGYVTTSENDSILGIDTYLYTDEDIVQPGQVYPLPEKYKQHSYALKYKDLSGTTLELSIYQREHFSTNMIISGWNRVETTSIDDTTAYLCYRRWEDGVDYLDRIVLEHPELPGILTLTKHDLLSDINAESMINLVDKSLAELKKLPILY